MFEKFLSTTRGIHGKSVINHKVRHRLKLSNDEYVVIDLIHRLSIQNKEFTEGRLLRWIAMKVDEVRPILSSLKSKGLYEVKVVDGEDKFFVSKRYQKAHKIELDDDYEFFWQKRGDRKWHGSKKAGKELYNKVVARVGSQYINDQKEAYFKYLNHPSTGFRSIMNITTFLNLETQRFSENWTEYLEEAIVKESGGDKQQESANTITSRDDVDKKFE
jgi:hypothetical protein